MFKDLIIILISVVSLTSGQNRPCWTKRPKTGYPGLWNSYSTSIDACYKSCELRFPTCWIISYISRDWYPCYVLASKIVRDESKFVRNDPLDTYLLDRECYEAIPVRPCWRNKFRSQYTGLYNSYTKTLDGCLDECIKYTECLMIGYIEDEFYPCYYNYQKIKYNVSHYYNHDKSVIFKLDRSCLTSTQGSTTTTIAARTTTIAGPTTTMEASPSTTIAGPTTTMEASPSTTIEDTPTPTIEAGTTPTIEAGPTPTIEAGPTPTIEAGPTPTIEAGPTPTIEAGTTPTIEAGPTPTIEAGPTPTIEADPTPTIEAGPTPTIEGTPTPTIEAGPTPTIEASPTTTIEASPTTTIAAPTRANAMNINEDLKIIYMILPIVIALAMFDVNL